MQKILSRFICLALISSLNACLFLPKPGEEVQRAVEIEKFYEKWRGTRYQLGGADGEGIDCSALMVEVYDDVFDMDLPRTTESQSELGKRVRQKNLSTGDLVFFKTGVIKRHVGIYLSDGIFLHASQSRGVTKSSLYSPYWSAHYWKAKRLSN